MALETMDGVTKLMSYLALAMFLASGARAVNLEVVHQWKYLDWVYPNVESTQNAFIPENPFTQDVDVDRIGRVFVTSPRWLEGTPIVLSTVTNVNGPGGPLLVPYPDWTWHRPYDCNSLISPYRIAIDECNRLWVVDTGRISGKPVCPTKIIIFDLNNDQVIHKYEVPSDQSLNGAAGLVTPIVEVGDNCLDTYLYIADVDQNGIVVYDLKHDYSWRINNTKGNAFGPDDDGMDITIAGESFNLTDGTLGMSLSPRGFYECRYLYFNSLASFYQKFSDTRSLKAAQFKEPVVYQSNEKRVSQAGVQATSKRGIIFFQLAQLTALACWNIEKPFTPENVVIVAQNEEALQYISGIKIITNFDGDEEVWFNTNRLQKTINKTRKSSETNFRVIKGKVDDLVRGTNCESSGSPGPSPDMSSWHEI